MRLLPIQNPPPIPLDLPEGTIGRFDPLDSASPIARTLKERKEIQMEEEGKKDFEEQELRGMEEEEGVEKEEGVEGGDEELGDEQIADEQIADEELVDSELVEVEVDSDSTVLSPPVSPPIPVLSSLERLTSYTSMLTSSTSPTTLNWKPRANALKFERVLEEKYGFLKPILTDPRVSKWVKRLQRRHARGLLSPFRKASSGGGILGGGGMGLFVLLRKGWVTWEVAALLAAYGVGLRAWALVAAVGVTWIWGRGREKRWMGGGDMKRRAKERVGEDAKWKGMGRKERIEVSAGRGGTLWVPEV